MHPGEVQAETSMYCHKNTNGIKSENKHARDHKESSLQADPRESSQKTEMK